MSATVLTSRLCVLVTFVPSVLSLILHSILVSCCQLYILEETAASLARQLLLLSLFTDFTLLPRERLESFLDIHHNALIQQRTAAHSTRLIQQLTQHLNTETATHTYDQADYRSYAVDLSHLKRKELDATMHHLAFIAAAAKTSTSSSFDVSALLDARWRHYYGERYESRHNLIDSDYHFRLKLVAPVCHIVHFRRWRVTGQAYERRECTYDVGNRSLASEREAKAKGRGAVEVRGYWGDVVLGPSTVYGVDSSNEANYETRQNQHVKTAVDISEDNVSALMAAAGDGREGQVPRVSFHFLQGTVASLASKSRYRGLFHRVFLSHFQYAQLPSLPALLSSEVEHVPLTMDTLYYWPLKEEEKQAAQEKLREKVTQSGGVAGRWEQREVRSEEKRMAAGGRERKGHGHKFISFVWHAGASSSVPLVEERKEQLTVK